jgi:hypothetical protein
MIVLLAAIASVGYFLARRTDVELQAEEHREILNDYFGIRAWIASVADCNSTIATISACTGQLVAVYGKGGNVIIAADQDAPTKIGRNYYLRARCEGAAVVFEASRRYPGGAAMSDPLTKRAFDWENLFAKIPTDQAQVQYACKLN